MSRALLAIPARVAQMSPVVIGSLVLHMGIAMALVATPGGHARAGVMLPVATLDVDVVPIDAPILEPVRDEAAPPPKAPRDHAPHNETAPAHTHPYPVAPSHDAHPHDPSFHHPSPEADPALAAPVRLAEPSDAPVLPRFSIPSGAGLAPSDHVSANGGGRGGGAGMATSGESDDVIVPESAVQVSAKLVESVVATYPAAARSDDIEGDVGVEIVVDRDGRVVEARIARPAGHGFDDAALAAIRRYRFTSAQREGHAVRVRMPWAVQFRLR